MEYVVAILFDGPRDHVVLIEKDHPEWQRGRLNGMGGKIEAGETAAEACSRECLEEGGVTIPAKAWREFAAMQFTEDNGTTGVVHFLTAACEANLKSLTTEEVSWYSVWGVLDGDLLVIPNLRWLVPMAMDPGRPICTFYEAGRG